MTECHLVHLNYVVLDAWTLSFTCGACYGHPGVGKQGKQWSILNVICPAQNCLQLHIQQCFDPNVTLSTFGLNALLEKRSAIYYGVSYDGLYDSISSQL